MNRPLHILLVALAATLPLCLAAPTGTAAEGAPPPRTNGGFPQEAIAVVNGRPVPRREFYRSLARTMGRAAIDSFLDRVLVRQAAEERGIEITPGEVEQRRELEARLRMRRLYEQARMSPGEFRKAARAYGWDQERTRREITSGISEASARLQLMVEKLLAPEIEITEQQLRSYYGWTRGPRLASAHILVESSEKAKEVIETLKDSPESWQQMVQNHTLDRPSVPYSGRMQPIPADCPMGRALGRIQPGQARIYSDGERWHILRLIGRVPAEAESFDEVRGELRREFFALRAQQLADALIARLRRQAMIVTNVAASERKRRLLGTDVVAYANGRPVPVKEFGRVLLEQFGAALLQPFIERQLIFQRAAEKNVQVSAETVTERRRELAQTVFEQRQGQAGEDSKEIRRHLPENGISRDQYTEKLAEELISPAEIRALLLAEKMVAGDLSITSEDLRQAYNRRYGEHVTVRRLVVNSRREAADLRERAQSGVSFDLLVQTQSDRPLSWDRGGMVSDITPDHPFFPYVEPLQSGQISPILEHNGRFYLLKVIAYHEPNDPPTLESVRDELRELARKEKARSRITAWLQKLKAESRVQILQDIES